MLTRITALQTSLGNAQVSIVASKGTKLSAPLFMVSPGRINCLIPANAALGKGTVTVTSGTAIFQGTLEIAKVAPALVTANSRGKGTGRASITSKKRGSCKTLPLRQIDHPALLLIDLDVEKLRRIDDPDQALETSELRADAKTTTC